MRTIESALQKTGFTKIAGIDEAGRGPLAGPVVAAAVRILPADFNVEIIDSKRLSPKKREQAYEEICETCLVGVGIASVEEINELNILQATLVAMRRAVEKLPERPDFCLVDGNQVIPQLVPAQKTIVNGDNLSLSIAAASIVAKVERDALMLKYHKIYPEYNFAQNKGYATKEHREALGVHGACPVHRQTFRGVGS